MSGLEDMLSELLSSPDAMEKLTQAAGQLGLDLDGGKNEPPSEQTGISPAVSKLLPMMGGRHDDRYARLIAALRPFLSEKRQERLKEAERMLSMLNTVETMRAVFASGGEEDGEKK